MYWKAGPNNMAYEKQNFKDGDVLTAAALNHMEEGICQVLPEVNFQDAGKFLRVSGAGVWCAEQLTDVSEVGA